MGVHIALIQRRRIKICTDDNPSTRWSVKNFNYLQLFTIPWKAVDMPLVLSYIRPLVSGHSSVGRVQASQAWCREFESRCPLHH